MIMFESRIQKIGESINQPRLLIGYTEHEAVHKIIAELNPLLKRQFIDHLADILYINNDYYCNYPSRDRVYSLNSYLVWTFMSASIEKLIEALERTFKIGRHEIPLDIF